MLEPGPMQVLCQVLKWRVRWQATPLVNAYKHFRSWYHGITNCSRRWIEGMLKIMILSIVSSGKYCSPRSKVPESYYNVIAISRFYWLLSYVSTFSSSVILLVEYLHHLVRNCHLGLGWLRNWPRSASRWKVFLTSWMNDGWLIKEGARTSLCFTLSLFDILVL